MKLIKTSLLIGILFLLTTYNIHADDKLPYDSIVVSLSDKKMSIDDKYSFVGKIHHLPIKEQIAVNKIIANFVRHEDDKARLITIYAMLDNLYSVIKEKETGKIYLDSAMIYKNNTRNVNALGAMYYRTGMYYSAIGNDIVAHKNYYKAIANYKRSTDKKIMLSFIYYKMATTYLAHDDLKSLSNIVKDMLTIKLQGEDRIYYNNIYTMAALYYIRKAQLDTIDKKDSFNSAKLYLGKAIDTYHKHKTPNKMLAGATRLVSQNYYDMAQVLLQEGNSDIHIITQNINKGKQYMAEGDSATLTKYHEAMAALLSHKKQYRDAITEYKAKEALFKSKKYPQHSDRYLELYSQMENAYKQIGDTQNALVYSELRYELLKKTEQENKYKTIKDLEARYQTAEKDLKISQLNEEKHKARSMIIIIVSLSVFVIVILLFIFLYNRILRLKKEKETVDLSARIKEKDAAYQSLLKESEIKQMRDYLNGLETERNRLAKALHDSAANKLYLLDKNLKSIDNIPPDISTQIEEVYSQIRNVSHELISPAFQYATLYEILADHIGKLNKKTNIFFELKTSDKETINSFPVEIAHEIYRIVQECSGNIIKYANATEALVSLTYTDSILQLSIEDNGDGFNPQKKTKGIGLQIIEDRCKSLDGTIQIETEVGRGSKIKISIPYIVEHGVLAPLPFV